METLIEMFKELPALMQIFWVCALASSLFMVGQLISSMLGLGDMDTDLGDSVDGMDDSGGMDLFTVKNVTNFFVGFGWGGISFASVVEIQWLLVTLAVGCGILFVLLFILLFRQLMKIQSNSAVGIEASIGQIADVYLRIPAARSGRGKIQICIQKKTLCDFYFFFPDNKPITLFFDCPIESIFFEIEPLRGRAVQIIGSNHWLFQLVI